MRPAVRTTLSLPSRRASTALQSRTALVCAALHCQAPPSRNSFTASRVLTAVLLWRAGATENKMRELECTGAAYRLSGIDEVGSIHCLS